MHKLNFAIGLCLILIGCFVDSSFAANLNQLQIIKSDSYTRVIFSLSNNTASHIFTLRHPNRLVVDFTNTAIKVDLKKVNLPNQLITDIRSGRPMPHVRRIVFDLANPVRFTKTFSQDAKHHLQLTVDIFSIHPSNLKISKPIVTIPQLEVSVPAKKGRLQFSLIAKKHPMIVAIDAGHGGKDPGTIGPQGTREKDVVLAIALRLQDVINAQPNMHAILTRDGDYFVDLRGRMLLARKEKADIFISIHADSYFNPRSAGVSIFSLSRHGATTEAARWLANRENTSELGGIDLKGLGDKSQILRSVLIDLAQTATVKDSLQLGTCVLHSVGKVAKLHYVWVAQAPFVVLKSPDLPSVLVETGFLSNPREEDHLRDRAYQDKLAQAMLKGIQQYFKTHPTIGV